MGNKNGGGGGGNKPSPVVAASNTVETIGKIKKTQATLEKRTKVIEKNMLECLKKAQHYIKRNNKKSAILEMKKRKMQQKKLDQIQAYQLNLINMVDMLENAATSHQVADAMKVTTNQLKTIQKENNIEEMENLREDIEEAQAKQTEVEDLLAEPMAGTELDEDDLEDEYNSLMGEIEGEDELAAVTEVPTTSTKVADKPVDLPIAPTADPVVLPKPVTTEPVMGTTKSEEDELGELAGMFGV